MPALPRSSRVSRNEQATASRANLLIVGALADVVEDQLRSLLDGMGIEKVQFFPPRRSTELPEVGANTRFLLAQPFLSDTARALEERGARRIDAIFPSGAEGTRAWLRAAADAWAVDDTRFRRVTESAYERAQRSLMRYRDQLAGKRIFFFPDSQLEVPLARFLSQERAMELVEVGTPYLHRGHLSAELERLPPGTSVVEGQHVDNQLDRCCAPDRIWWSVAWVSQILWKHAG